MEIEENTEVKFVATKRKKNYLVSKPNWQTPKGFSKKLVSNRNKKQQY